MARAGIVSVATATAACLDQNASTNIATLQHLAIRGLASLAVSSSHAAEINKEGGLAVLVNLLIHYQFLSKQALAVLRHATRALANLACCAKPGTWQREAIGPSLTSPYFAYKAPNTTHYIKRTLLSPNLYGQFSFILLVCCANSLVFCALY